MLINAKIKKWGSFLTILERKCNHKLKIMYLENSSNKLQNFLGLICITQGGGKGKVFVTMRRYHSKLLGYRFG